MAYKHSTAPHPLSDTHQSFWQLAVIQLSGWTSLPIIATSILILQGNSFLGAVLTIVVGNAILWFIRLGIIAMSRKRQSTLDISQDYLGVFGSYFIATLLLISTLVWFIVQTTGASQALTKLISINEDPSIDKFSQMSVFLGIVSTFLCMGGIVVLRRLATFAFPILLVAFFVLIFAVPFEWPQGGSAVLSLSGLGLVLGTNLGITSDLPTFFRHSKSWLTSIKALTLIQLISLALGLCSLYFASIISGNFEVNEQVVLGSGNELLRTTLVIFVFLSVICANVANVYSASVGWEVLAPSALVGRKEYLILGLGLTMVFVLIDNSFPMEVLLSASDSSLVNLCLVLILGYMISRFKKRLPNAFEQVTYFVAWLVSTIFNCFQYTGLLAAAISPLATGLAIIMLTIAFAFSWKRLRRRGAAV